MTRVAASSHIYARFPVLAEALLAAYPDARINRDKERFTEDELIAFLDGREAAIVSIVPPITERVLAALPDLKVVSCGSAGVDHVDAAACKRHGVRMGWFPGVNRDSVAEMALSMMINLLRHFNDFNQSMRAGRWPQRRPGRLLKGRVVGIHGCGHIGQQLVRLLQPFECEILANDRRDFADFYRRYGVKPVSPETLWAQSEILTLHLSRNSTTVGLYDAATLDKLRPGCLLVNTARGRIVDEAALKERLRDGRIAAAAFDVFAVEPVVDWELASLPNLIATPHIAGGAMEAMMAMGRAGIRGLSENAVPEPGVYPFD